MNGVSVIPALVVLLAGVETTGARARESAATAVPAERIPPFEGLRYEITVPDTLDLAERMRLSINGFTRCVSGPPANPFPPTRYVCNHFIAITPWPKVLRNVPIYGKFMESTLLARMTTGSAKGIGVDEDWRRAWLAWSRIDPVMHGPEGGRRLCWIAANALRERDPRWIAMGRRAVRRLEEVAVAHKDGAWIHVGLQVTPPDAGCANAAGASPTPQAVPAMKAADRRLVACGWNGTFMGWTLQGLCRFCEVTGDADALSLAGRLARYLKDDAEILAPDGRFLAGHPHAWPVVHWHHNCIVAQALLEYGLVAGDDEFIAFGRRVYDHAMTFCSRDIGFAPEYCYGKFPRKQSIDNTEACCSADLVMLALLLTKAGAGDYWDDVNRYVRNHIATLQLTDTRWFYNLPENRAKGMTYPDPKVEEVIGRLTGHFGGWAGVNEWHLPELGPGIMTCCISNCTRAFYHVHEDMVECDAGTLRVHLLLNRASRWADIHSHLPYEGKVVLVFKRPCKRVLVRAPEWIETDSSAIECTVNGKKAAVNWAGRYLDLGPARPGRSYTFRFPIETRRIVRDIGRRRFALTIKGRTVVGVDPPGTRIPLYQRRKYLEDKAPLVKVRRYVPANP